MCWCLCLVWNCQRRYRMCTCPYERTPNGFGTETSAPACAPYRIEVLETTRRVSTRDVEWTISIVERQPLMETGQSRRQSVVTLALSSMRRLYEVENLCFLCLFLRPRSGENVGKCVLCVFPSALGDSVRGVRSVSTVCVLLFPRWEMRWCLRFLWNCQRRHRMCSCPSSERRMSSVQRLQHRPGPHIGSSFSKQPVVMQRGAWNGRYGLWRASR